MAVVVDGGSDRKADADGGRSSAWSGCTNEECEAWKSEDGGVLGSDVAAASRKGNKSRRGVGVGSGATSDEEGTTGCTGADGAKCAEADDDCEGAGAVDGAGCCRVPAALERPLRLTVGRRTVEDGGMVEAEDGTAGGACEVLAEGLPRDC